MAHSRRKSKIANTKKMCSRKKKHQKSVAVIQPLCPNKIIVRGVRGWHDATPSGDPRRYAHTSLLSENTQALLLSFASAKIPRGDSLVAFVGVLRRDDLAAAPFLRLKPDFPTVSARLSSGLSRRTRTLTAFFRCVSRVPPRIG